MASCVVGYVQSKGDSGEPLGFVPQEELGGCTVCLEVDWFRMTEKGLKIAVG